MKTSYSRNRISLAVAFALALGFVTGAAQAQAPNFGAPADRELWTAAPAQVWKNGYGECWHSAFGPPPPAGECDPAPRPIAQAAPAAPAPRPVPVVSPPRPVAEKINLDADVLFAFDKSVLKPEGKEALDGLVGKLQGVNLENLTAIGHTDRFGSDSYNQALSERRVATVKAYLLDKGVAQNRMHTEAMGETQPVTKAGDCTGPKNAKTIACLQPDRRVEVEVIGTTK